MLLINDSIQNKTKVLHGVSMVDRIIILHDSNTAYSVVARRGESRRGVPFKLGENLKTRLVFYK